MEPGYENQLNYENSEEIEHIKKYRVILLNDDYTSMDFVVEILTTIFGHNLEDAINIMLKIHKEEKGVCGVYTYEVAETKISQVKEKAQENEYPLRAIMEEA